MADYNYTNSAVLPQQANYASLTGYGNSAAETYATHSASSYAQPTAQSYGQQAYSPYDQTHSSQSSAGTAQQLAQYAPTGVPAPVAYAQTYAQNATPQAAYAAQTYSQQTATATAYGQQQVQPSYQTQQTATQYAQSQPTQYAAAAQQVQPAQAVTYVVQDQAYAQQQPSAYAAQVASASYAQPQQVVQTAYGQQQVVQPAAAGAGAAYAGVPATYAIQAAGAYNQLPPPTYGQQQVTPASVLPTALTQQTAYAQPVQTGLFGQQATFDANAAPPNFAAQQLALAAAGLTAPPPSLVPQGVTPVQAALAALPAASQQNLAAAVAAAAAAAAARGLSVGGLGQLQSLLGPAAAALGGSRSLAGPGGFGGVTLGGSRQDGPPADMILEAPDTVHIAGLPEDINEDMVADFFGSFGPLKIDKRSGRPCVYVPRDTMTGRSRGEASISYVDPQAAERSTRFFLGKDFRGRRFSVSISDGRGGRIPITPNMVAGGGPGGPMRDNMGMGGGNMGMGGGNRGGRGDGGQGFGGGNRNGGGGGGGSGGAGSRSGDWKCDGCGNQNFAWRTECNRCKEPKELVASRDGGSGDAGSRDNRGGGMRGGRGGGGGGGRNFGGRDGPSGGRDGGPRGPGGNLSGRLGPRIDNNSRGGGPMKGRDDKDRKNRPY